MKLYNICLLWLISLSIIFSGFIHVVGYCRISFLRLHNISLYVCTTFGYPFIRQWNRRCFLVCAIVDNAAINLVHKCLFKTLFFILLAVYSEEELLDHLVILFLIFQETLMLFSTVAVPFYISTHRTQSFHFPRSLTHTWFVFWQ